VRAATGLVGGPAGRRTASATGFWRALPVLVLLACAVLSFGVVQKQHCRAQGWSSPDQFWHACYSDIPVLYGSAQLGADPRPGLAQSLSEGLGQPPLAGALMWVTSAFVPKDGATAPRQFFDLSAVMLALVLAVGVAAAVLVKGRRPWDAAHLALSPVLITAGLISYQVLSLTLLAVSVLALARGRAVLGGVLLGLAVTAAPQLAVVVVAATALGGRFVRRGAGVVIGAVSALTCLAVRVVLLPGLTGGLIGAWRAWVDSLPGYGSLWLVPQLLHDSRPDGVRSLGGRILLRLFGWIFRVGALHGTVASILSVVLLTTLIAVILRLTVLDGPVGAGPVDSPDVRPSDFLIARFAPLALALLAAGLVSVKSLPVQTSLVLLPLIALSGLRWRDHLIWAATESVYFVGVWLYIAGETTPSRGLPAPFYLTMLLARLAGITWVGVQGVRGYRAHVLPARAGDVAAEAGSAPSLDPAGGQTGPDDPACGQISYQADVAGRLLGGPSAAPSPDRGVAGIRDDAPTLLSRRDRDR
jgi:hypothetical protein